MGRRALVLGALPGASVVLAAIVLAAAPGSARAAAQEPTEPPPSPATEYRAPADTVWYERTRPHHVYWLRGADTLGWRGVEAAVEAHVWTRPAPDKLAGTVLRTALDSQRGVEEDTIVAAPWGRVRSIRGPGAGSPWPRDLLPPLPVDGRAVAAGDAWSDTLAAAWSDQAGHHRFDLARRLEVWAIEPGAAGRVARIRAEGEVLLHTAFVLEGLDSVVTTVALRGPVEETFRVDLDAGVLLSRDWSMRLDGTGTIGTPDSAGEALPAGLAASGTLRRIDGERAAVLARPLPGTDTTYATVFEDARVTLHTAEIRGGRIDGGRAGEGGDVSTVELLRPGTERASLRWLRSAPGEPVGEVRVGAWPGGAEGTSPAPEGVDGRAFWIPGHEELLVPLALTLPLDSVARRVAVWSVPERAWIEGDALLLELEGVTLAVFTFDPPLPVLSLLVDEDGRLLYVERGSEGERAPPAGTPARDRVDELVEAFTAIRPRPPPRGQRS